MPPQPKDDPASPVRLAVYGTCAGTAAIGLGQGLGSALFSAAAARTIALAVIATLVSIAAGMICDPVLSRWQRLADQLHRRSS
ncbi:hypothetical protein [Actinoplanes sp. NPDC051859]|uniref:hypothetical protein n=1 Tax=Actinoplanes sp. NPDC051859 TaxID=3363909 RepID=UPI003792AD7E